jgi:hypothetical protein
MEYIVVRDSNVDTCMTMINMYAKQGYEVVCSHVHVGPVSGTVRHFFTMAREKTE